MNSIVRDVEIPISRSNVEAHFEELLRRLKYIADDEDLVSLDLSDIIEGFKSDGKTKTDVLPLRFKTRREEVEVIKHW